MGQAAAAFHDPSKNACGLLAQFLGELLVALFSGNEHVKPASILLECVGNPIVHSLDPLIWGPDIRDGPNSRKTGRLLRRAGRRFASLYGLAQVVHADVSVVARGVSHPLTVAGAKTL